MLFDIRRIQPERIAVGGTAWGNKQASMHSECVVVLVLLMKRGLKFSNTMICDVLLNVVGFIYS